MREYQLQKLYNLYGKKTVKNHIKWVDLSTITDVNQRARANGNQQNNISNFTALFSRGDTQTTPVSLRNGHEVMDGVSRYRGKVGADKVVPQKLLVCTFMDEVLKFSDEEWHDWQDDANNHINTHATTNADIDESIRWRVANNTLTKMVHAHTNDPTLDPNNPKTFNAYCKAAGEALHEKLWYNQPFGASKITKRVKDIVRAPVNVLANRKTYDMSQLVAKYEDENTHGWTGKSFAKIAANTHVAVLNAEGRIDPNIGGVMLKNAEDNPGITQVVLISFKDLNGLTDKDIKDSRKRIAKRLYRYANRLGMKLSVEYVNQLGSDKPGLTKIRKNSSKGKAP